MKGLDNNKFLVLLVQTITSQLEKTKVGLGALHIAVHHLLHKLIERDFLLPAQHGLGLGAVTNQ